MKKLTLLFTIQLISLVGFCQFTLVPSQKDESCFNRKDGKALALPVNGLSNATYSYCWNNDYTDGMIDSLTNGHYWVEVTDSYGNSKVQSFYIKTPDKLIVSPIEDIKTNINSEISIAISPIGGNGEYEYCWSNGDSNPLTSYYYQTPGDYKINVLIYDGCYEAVYLEANIFVKDK